MKVRIERSNPFKLGLASSGAGFLMGGTLSLIGIGPNGFGIGSVVLGVVFFLISLTISGPWVTKFHRVGCSCRDLHDPYCAEHGGL